MKYYLAISKTTRGYIIMHNDCYYYWCYASLPMRLDVELFRKVAPGYTVDRWLSKLASSGMHLLASFDDYVIFKQDHPEYFI